MAFELLLESAARPESELSEKRKLNLLSLVLRRGAVLLLICAQSAVSLASEWQFSGVDRVVAVSDIHGAYDAMISTFTKANIIDENGVLLYDARTTKRRVRK